MTIRPASEVNQEVQAIINAIAGEKNTLFFSVRACREKTGLTYRSGPATGMYQIDIWSLRSQLNPRSREHMFRTNKQGVVPAEKIRAFVKEALTIKKECDAAKCSREAIRRNNEALAFDIRNIAKDSVGYASEYSTNNQTFVSADSGTEGKVKVGLTSLVLTPEQAKQLFALVATFR